MDTGDLFVTAVPEEQLREGSERALRRIFGPRQCLRSIEEPREERGLPAIVQDRAQEHWQKGLDFSSCGQWEEAVICYSKAISLDPQRAELYLQRAEAFLQLCDFQSAVLNMRKALALDPARHQHCLRRLALVLELQGQCLLEQELYCEALEAFTRAAELQPRCRALRQRSVTCLAALNKFPECLQTLNRDVKEDPRNPDLLVLRAAFYERFGQPALCHQDIQRALVLEPQHGAAHALKQRLLQRGREAKAEAVTKALCGDLQGALLKVSFAIENDPSAADLFILRGTLLRRLQNFTAACEDLARVRVLAAAGSPEAREAQRQLMLTHNDCAARCYALGLFEEAVGLLGEALQDEKHEEGLYINRGDCFLRLGELPLALADYEQALELSPGDRRVQRRIATALHEQGQRDLVARQYPRAEAGFSAAIECDPCKPLYYLSRARSHLCQGRVRNAREDVALSLWLDPTDSEVLSFVRYLFPRKTVQAVLRSETGRLAKETLDKMLQGPAELPASADVTWGGGHSRPPVTLEGAVKEAVELVDAKGATSDYKLREEPATCAGTATRVIPALLEAGVKEQPFEAVGSLFQQEADVAYK